MPSPFLQPHTFSQHFYSFIFPAAVSSPPSSPLALLPTLCLAVFTCRGGRGSILFPLPHFIQGGQSPFSLPSSPSASRTTSSLPPSAPGIVPRGSSKAPEPASLSSQAGFLQRNPSPAYFGSGECLTLALGRKPKATHHFVSINKMVLLGCFISPHCSPLLPPEHITFPG